MPTRRTFLAGAVTAAAASAVVGPMAYRAKAAPSTLNINIVNNTGSSDAFAYVHGFAINSGNALFLLQSDGHTPYFPASPSSTLSPLGANCSIPLGAPGSTTQITIPQLAGARLWCSIGAPITFLLNPGPALVEPSVTNPQDPNINTSWDFCEFTFNQGGIYANISFVDFVAIPISLTLTGSGGTQQVQGLPNGGLDQVCSALSAQASSDGKGWNQLIVTSGGGNLRALSPTNGIVMNASLLSGYFDDYLSQVWSKYAGTSLSVDTQASWGTVTGQVSGGQLTFPGVGSYAQPASRDIFSCASGPFTPVSPEMDAVTARLAAALNRSTLLSDANQPDGENPSTYYTNAATNHYSRIVHQVSQDHRGYGFPYDDVAPTGGADQSGFVSDPSPSLLTVGIGH